MKTITAKEIEAMDKRFRTHLINSLSGFKSVNLVGTVDPAGRTNLALFSSVVHLGAEPALLGMVSRPDSVPRHTLQNILATGWYSLNHVNEEILPQAHQCSARYGDTESEFSATGLTACYSCDIPAPKVQESALSMLIEYQEHHRFAINNTIFVIGKLAELTLPEAAVCPSGYIDLESINTVVCSGLDSYHRTQSLQRFAYAKPDLEPTEIELKV